LQAAAREAGGSEVEESLLDADALLAAHGASGDAELSAAIARERERSREEEAAAAVRQRNTPVKAKPPTKRRLAKGGKATPGMAERLASAAQENADIN